MAAAATAPAPEIESKHVTKAAPVERSYGLLVAGVITGVAGLASVGMGIYYYDRARYYSAQASVPNPDPADENAGKHAETMQWIFYGFGGVALAAGTDLRPGGLRGATCDHERDTSFHQHHLPIHGPLLLLA